MMFLKQSTASQSVLIGPFIDETDGISALTGLTIANTDIRLSANGGNMAAKNSGGGTHDELGFYTITLDATDTATVGRLQLVVHATGALPVYHEFQVVEEAISAALFDASATGALPVSTGGIATTAFATGAIDAAALAADAGTEIGTAVWASGTRTLTALDENSTTLDLDATIRAAVGLASADLDTQIAALPTAAENFTAALTTQLTQSYASNGTAPTLAQAIFAIHQRLMAFAISGTSLTVKQLNGSDTAFVVTHDSADEPTSAARS
jgi:hypothetical protein